MKNFLAVVICLAAGLFFANLAAAGNMTTGFSSRIPTGMAVKDDKVINALACDGDTLYISLTDSGKIYALDIKNPARLDKSKLWLKITGANGMAIDIATKNFRVIYQEDGIGPADIAQSGGRLFIPELVGNRIIEIQIGDFK